jgi:alkylhydroperoxidase family enzyme
VTSDPPHDPTAGRERPAQPRLEPASEIPEDLRPLVRNPRDGRTTNLGGTLAHNPELLRRFNAFGGWMLEGKEIPVRERVIVALRVGWRTRSVYEFGQNRRRSKQAGLAREQIEALTRTDPGDAFGPGERLLVRVIDELCIGDGVSDATWREAAEHWQPAALVELLLLVGFYRMLAGFLNGAGVSRDPGVPGWPWEDPAT